MELFCPYATCGKEIKVAPDKGAFDVVTCPKCGRAAEIQCDYWLQPTPENLRPSPEGTGTRLYINP